MKKYIRNISIILFSLAFLLNGFGILFADSVEKEYGHESEKGAAQIWTESCMRCHTIRTPSYYSDQQWDIVVHHMRVRANLTQEESDKIREFLKTAN